MSRDSRTAVRGFSRDSVWAGKRETELIGICGLGGKQDGPGGKGVRPDRAASVSLWLHWPTQLVHWRAYLESSRYVLNQILMYSHIKYFRSSIVYGQSCWTLVAKISVGPWLRPNGNQDYTFSRWRITYYSRVKYSAAPLVTGNSELKWMWKWMCIDIFGHCFGGRCRGRSYAPPPPPPPPAATC